MTEVIQTDFGGLLGAGGCIDLGVYVARVARGGDFHLGRKLHETKVLILAQVAHADAGFCI